jgi:DNA-binding SARP family transcriptional activator/tetratricopeptide (TPR) repeat protein
VQFGVLGPTELRGGEHLIPLGAAKQRGLLALLLVDAGRAVRVDVLVEHLWPDGGPANPRRAIWPLVCRLRKVFVDHEIPASMVRENNAYRVDVDPLIVDLHRFRALLDTARKALDTDRPGAAVSALEEAIGLWRGDEAVPELRGPSAERLRNNLGEEKLDAFRLLATGLLRLGRHDVVLMRMSHLLREHPLDESLARLWIGALLAAGREPDARRYLATFRKSFRREMRQDPVIDLDVIQAQRPGPAFAHPRQLPPDVPGFVGRTALLADLDRFVEPVAGKPNVVVVTGMPGIGKTSLVRFWAQRNLQHFPDGQLHVAAGAFGPGAPVDPMEALARFLHALGVPPDRIPKDGEDRRSRFNDLVADRRVLVVLDNVASSEQARPLIPTSGTCLTIITSRERLSGLAIRDGVHHLVCDRLADTDCRALLTQIIGTSRASSESAAVNRLAALADGLPLAVRIVGVHVADRPRAQIADLVGELRDRVPWAHSEEGDLSSIFDWSYRKLDPVAATMFRRLALHPGARISLEAAAVLTGSGPRTAEFAIDVLARANLVEHDIARHYRMHDLLRQYALARCASDETDDEIAACRSAVTAWFLCTAANAAAILAPRHSPVPDLPAAPPGTLTFTGEAAARAWCAAERTNLGTAAREAARHGLHRLAWQLPAAIHETFSHTGRYDDLIHLNRLAAASARRDGHAFGEIANRGNLGHAYSATHQYAAAIVELAKARELAAAAGDALAENICAHNLGAAYLNVGDTPRAIATLEQVRLVFRRLGHLYGEAAALHRLGDAYRAEGRSEMALAAYTDALAIREQDNEVREQGLTHQRLSEFHLQAGDLTRAARHCATALACHDRVRETEGRCDALITRADIERAAGSGTAVLHARVAVAACADLADSYRSVRSMIVLAESLAAADAIGEATRMRAAATRTVSELSGPEAASLRARLESA